MKAKVTRSFNGCEDGQNHPRTIAVGEIIDGDLGRVAVEQGWAKSLDAPKNKARTVPKNKSGAASQAGHRSRKKTAKKSGKRTLKR